MKPNITQVNPDRIAAETATKAIQDAMTAQSVNQIAIGRMFYLAVKAEYPKILGYESVKDYCAKRFDWHYSSICDFVKVAKIGELAGWSDAELMTVGVNGKAISGLLHIGRIIQYCGKTDADKGETLKKLLTRCKGKKLEYISEQCLKLNPVGKKANGGKPPANPPANGAEPPATESAESMTVTFTGVALDAAIVCMKRSGIDHTDESAVNVWFSALLTHMASTDKPANKSNGRTVKMDVTAKESAIGAGAN